MTNLSKLSQRFTELEAQLEIVKATKHAVHSEFSRGFEIDGYKYLNWVIKARHLLGLACGPNSIHFAEFKAAEMPGAYESAIDAMPRCEAIFAAAREDYEGGYLISARRLVQAEVFDSELEQARALLDAGYRVAAAVIAGTVLETALRELCVASSLQVGKLDKMNSDLAKAGTYSLLVQKRITALADIRNNAAHGHPDKFTTEDVQDMIDYVTSFLAERLG